MLKQAWAFIKRDFLLETSYKFAFFTKYLGIIFWPFIFYFLSQLVDPAVSPTLQQYGGGYFSFVLIGIAFSRYQWVGLGAYIGSIRREEMMGTLEAMLTTPARFSIIVASSSLWKYMSATVEVVLLILLGVLFFGLDLENANYLSAVVIIFLMITSFSSIGILSASLIIVIKQGGIVNTLFNNLSALLGGIFFPIALLPDWLKMFSYLLPITYSLKAMRYAMFQGYSLMNLIPEVTALLAFSLIMSPLSILVFRYAVKKAKIDGSLGQY